MKTKMSFIAPEKKNSLNHFEALILWVATFRVFSSSASSLSIIEILRARIDTFTMDLTREAVWATNRQDG